ncbi:MULTISPECIES: hypothetical protein [unclassified Haloferax]|nr:MULTISPECIES: hypothetical protein [unclassified Haloferax]
MTISVFFTLLSVWPSRGVRLPAQLSAADASRHHDDRVLPGNDD